MKRSEVYRKAAELIDSRKQLFSCHAVICAELGGIHTHARTEARKAYAKLMGFSDGTENESSLNEDELWDLAQKERKELRVWLLLMAAAEAEAHESNLQRRSH